MYVAERNVKYNDQIIKLTMKRRKSRNNVLFLNTYVLFSSIIVIYLRLNCLLKECLSRFPMGIQQSFLYFYTNDKKEVL